MTLPSKQHGRTRTLTGHVSRVRNAEGGFCPDGQGHDPKGVSVCPAHTGILCFDDFNHTSLAGGTGGGKTTPPQHNFTLEWLHASPVRE
jgi:hypothetical protein